MDNKNICCRLFKEQIDLINQLPENERAIVLYGVINDLFNQFDNQNENQIENQNEYAYISVSVNNNIYNNYNILNNNNISVLGKSIYNLLRKNIVCKEFSSNYGGKRANAGAKKKEWGKTSITDAKTSYTPVNTITHVNPTEQEVLDYAKQQDDMAGVGGFAVSQEQAQAFYDYYSGIGWVLPNDAKTPIVDWKPFLRKWAKNPRFKNRESDTVDINDPDHFLI